MVCSKCNQGIAEDVKFCPNCGDGQNIFVHCTNCNHKTARNTSFCPNCGNEIKDHDQTKDDLEIWQIFSRGIFAIAIAFGIMFFLGRISLPRVGIFTAIGFLTFVAIRFLFTNPTRK